MTAKPAPDERPADRERERGEAANREDEFEANFLMRPSELDAAPSGLRVERARSIEAGKKVVAS